MSDTSLTESALADSGFQLNTLGDGADINEDMGLEEFVETLEKLTAAESGLFWVKGDLLAFGFKKWGREFIQTLRLSKVDLKKMKTAMLFPRGRRFPVSPTHHRCCQELDLGLKESAKWLGKAVAKGWSKRTLLLQIRRHGKKVIPDVSVAAVADKEYAHFTQAATFLERHPPGGQDPMFWRAMAKRLKVFVEYAAEVAICIEVDES